jgi:hypothetical protein
MAAKRKPRGSRQSDPAAELGAIKRLLVLQLLTSGVQGTQIASALGVDKSVVSRLVPTRKIKLKKRSRKR